MSNTSGQLDEWVEIPSYRPELYYKNVDSPTLIGNVSFSDTAVFPPRNHEDLPVASSNGNDQLSEVQQQQRFSSSSLLSSDGNNANEQGEDGEVNDKAMSRISLGLGFLRDRIAAVGLGMRNFAVSKARILWLVTSATTGLGALMFVMFLLYLRFQRRQRQAKLENRQHLMQQIKEKDQKITELLFQIAQLNDILLQRRRVPVVMIPGH